MPPGPAEAPRTIYLPIDPSALGITGGAKYTVSLATNGRKKQLGTITAKTRGMGVTLPVRSGEVHVIELRKH